MTIGKINIEKALILAPMEGVTELPFRIICKRMGADHVYTEFIASDAIVRDVEKSIRKMKFIEEERPISVQIFGSDENAMCKSAQYIEASGADIVDINFGCWVTRVVNNNSGAAFLKEPERMMGMAAAVAKSVSIPVTAKTRLGWDSNSINIVEVAQMLEQAGMAAIAVHCRTRAMSTKGKADWTWIPKIKEKIKIPVILNGDVESPEDVKTAFDSTGCDAVMIGRASIGNPFIFRNTKDYLKEGHYTEATVRERIDTLLEHLALSLQYKSMDKGIREFRKHYSGYLKGLHGSSSIRQKLVLMDSLLEIEETLNSYHDYLIEGGNINIEHQEVELSDLS